MKKTILTAALVILAALPGFAQERQMPPIFGSFTNTSMNVSNQQSYAVALEAVYCRALTSERFGLVLVNRAGYTNVLVRLVNTNELVWTSGGARIPMLRHGFIQITKTNAQRTVKYTVYGSRLASP